jgi:hypothetical protein
MITPDEILHDTPGNQRVQHMEANIPRRNKREYPVLVYFDNNKLEWNRKQVSVCFYQGCWARLGYSKEDNSQKYTNMTSSQACATILTINN